MRTSQFLLTLALVAAYSLSTSAGERVCRRGGRASGVEPLGAKSDVCWQRQEANAEMSDFVVYQHEFAYNQKRLNTDGEDHVRQIAARLLAGLDAPVVIERSMTAVREETEFKYPIHPNSELDLQRREVLVLSLTAMGISDADQRVVVAPAYVPGMKATEAAAAYQRGFGQQNNGWGAGGAAGWGGGSFGPFSSFGLGR